MATLAVLHPSIEAQLQNQNPTAGRHLSLACAAKNLENLELFLGQATAQVIVLDLALLGDEPATIVERLRATYHPELIVIIYSYATRTQLTALDLQGVKLLRTPVSLSLLRASMMSLIARDLFSTSGAAQEPSDPLVPVSQTLHHAVRSLHDLSLSIANVPPLLLSPGLQTLAQNASQTKNILEKTAKQLHLPLPSDPSL